MPPIGYPGNSISKEARAKAGGGFESAIENAAPSGLQFVAETGFSVTGSVEDLAEVTISGQDFGTKPPQRHFDRIDRYWANGVEVVDPYNSPVDGDNLPTSLAVADAPFLGTSPIQMEAWRFKQEAARSGRSVGYQLDAGPTGDFYSLGTATTSDGFAGYPASQRDSEEIYIRFWHYQKYFDNESAEGPMPLASTLSAGATFATLSSGTPAIGNPVTGLEELYITLDTGELHHCFQTEPITTATEFNFTPSLPSSAAAGNLIYRRKDATMKLLRMRDDEETATGLDRNVYSFSGFRSQISNNKAELEPGLTQGKWMPGVWQLHEIYMRAPKLEADLSANLVKRIRIDGDLRMDVQGLAESEGGVEQPPKSGWPSSGMAITNFGFEQDRLHSIPNNKLRYSDIYVDGQSIGVGVRRRVEIGIGSDDLYSCTNREPCPIKTWSGDITVNLNALPFTDAELSQARIFVVDADDVPTLVARVQQ